jgi:hypothetical protein
LSDHYYGDDTVWKLKNQNIKIMPIV